MLLVNYVHNVKTTWMLNIVPFKIIACSNHDWIAFYVQQRWFHDFWFLRSKDVPCAVIKLILITYLICLIRVVLLYPVNVYCMCMCMYCACVLYVHVCFTRRHGYVGAWADLKCADVSCVCVMCRELSAWLLRMTDTRLRSQSVSQSVSQPASHRPVWFLNVLNEWRFVQLQNKVQCCICATIGCRVCFWLGAGFVWWWIAHRVENSTVGVNIRASICYVVVVVVVNKLSSKPFHPNCN